MKRLSMKRTRKTVFGIKLPPIETTQFDGLKTSKDIDPEYYSMVEGRPIKQNNSINLYKKNIKEICLKKTLQGFVNDEIIRIDREIDSEQMIYKKASTQFEECQNSFDKFLADDNNKTIAIMQKSDALNKELNNAIEDHKQANFEMASLKSNLQYIHETLLILISFEKFLHKASPKLWQEQNNINLDTEHDDILVIHNDLFKPVEIKIINSRLNNLPVPCLYFENPDQMLEIFELLESQNLNFLLKTEDLTTQKNRFLRGLQDFKDLLRQEFTVTENEIRETEDVISRNDTRVTELKELFFKVLEHDFKYLMSSEKALQLYTYVEYAYEQLIASNETKLNALDMTLALETEYSNIMMALSVFSIDELKNIEKDTYAIGAEALRKARVANNLLKDVNKLSRRMKISYDPPIHQQK